MRIAVIGAGNVGGTLGRRWAALGHQVTFGVRESGEVKGGAPPGTRQTSVRDACRDAEVIALCTPWAAAPSAIASMGPLAGRVLFDSTNPIAPGFRLDVGPAGESGAERLATLAAGARVVKVFNTTGFQNMADPLYGGVPAVMFYAGDDGDAKALAHQLAAGLGFDPVDAGPLIRARELEHLALLWISLSVSGHGRDIALRLMRR